MANVLALVAPTKNLFIDTLVRDIDLEASIVDLIDNCIDGAKRIRPDENFEGLGVEVVINESLFQVSDNCGGIPLDIARKYAFRFGRDPTDHKGAVRHSVGHFGVGMKRTLFKLSERFIVNSITKSDQFKLDLDVGAWKSVSDWDFTLQNVVSLSTPDASRVVGTVIRVPKLRREIAEQFSLQIIVNEIRDRIAAAHTWAMTRGMLIKFNGELLQPKSLHIQTSGQIKPHVQIGTLNVSSSTESVSYRMITGIDERSWTLSGWYVFCNGRLLLDADQTAQTGWGSAPAQKFHQQFDRFRGYLFLDAANPGLLPWNTTKTGMSLDSEIYQQVVRMMSAGIYEVTQFLNKVRDEEKLAKKDEIEKTPLHDAIAATTSTEVLAGETLKKPSAKFSWPASSVVSASTPKEKRISYVVPTEMFNAVSEKLDLNKPQEVGLKTFDYFYSMQIEE